MALGTGSPCQVGRHDLDDAKRYGWSGVAAARWAKWPQFRLVRYGGRAGWTWRELSRIEAGFLVVIHSVALE